VDFNSTVIEGRSSRGSSRKSTSQAGAGPGRSAHGRESTRRSTSANREIPLGARKREGGSCSSEGANGSRRTDPGGAARTQERKRKLAGLNVVAPASGARAKRIQIRAGQVTGLRADETSRAAAISAAEAALRMSQAQVGNIKAQITKRSDTQAGSFRSCADVHQALSRDRRESRGKPRTDVAASLQAPVLFTIAQDLSRMQSRLPSSRRCQPIRSWQAVEFTVDAHPGRIFGDQ